GRARRHTGRNRAALHGSCGSCGCAAERRVRRRGSDPRAAGTRIGTCGGRRRDDHRYRRRCSHAGSSSGRRCADRNGSDSRRMMTYRSIRTVLLAAVWALTPVAVSAQVSGRVTDEGAGSPVSNALVWLNGQTVHMTHTDSAGAYAFTGIPPGSYCLHVETPGYAGSRVCISVSAQARIIVDLPLTAQPLVIAPIVVESRRSLDEVRVASADSAQVAPL